MALARVTVTWDGALLDEARSLSGGNFSRFVSALLQERIDDVRRQDLRAALRTGYQEEAEDDLAVAVEYGFVDAETARREEA